MKFKVALIFAASLLFERGAVWGQTSSVSSEPAFSVERLTPAPGPGAFWQVEDGDVAAHLATYFGVVTSISSRPLVIYSCCDTPDTDKGQPLTEPVATRVGVDVQAAIGLLGRYQLGVGFPMVAYQAGDRLQGLGLEDGDQELASNALGDLRLSAKARIVTPEMGYGWGVAAALTVAMPTGDAEAFAGETGMLAEPRACVSYRAPRFAVAANIGYRFRENEVEFLDPALVLGDELTWGLAASLVLPGSAAKASLMAEGVGAWGGNQGASPSEARLGARFRAGTHLAVGAFAGLGLGDQSAIGAPSWRAVVDLRFDSRPRTDTDRDGVPDARDRCPLIMEDKDDFQDVDGCPDVDNDQDRIPDREDACANSHEDEDGFQDGDGCPEPDNDQDGRLDGVDKCPRDAEDEDGFADDDGCPDRDNDGDGILDGKDACPDARENVDGNRDDDGCPEEPASLPSPA